MRTVASLLIGLLVCTACADPATLELWLSTSSSITSPPIPGNAVLPGGYSGKVYLWARTPGVWNTLHTCYDDGNGHSLPWSYLDWSGDVWQSISLGGVTTMGFSGTIDDPLAPSGTNLLRWDWLSSDFTWANGDRFTVYTQNDRGCGGASPPTAPSPGASVFDSRQTCDVPAIDGNAGFLYTRLGSITVSSAPLGARFFMEIGRNMLVRYHPWPGDLVQLGTGDPPVSPSSVGAVSALPDLVVVPEPGCVLMFVAAALATARRNRL